MWAVGGQRKERCGLVCVAPADSGVQGRAGRRTAPKEPHSEGGERGQPDQARESDPSSHHCAPCWPATRAPSNAHATSIPSLSSKGSKARPIGKTPAHYVVMVIPLCGPSARR